MSAKSIEKTIAFLEKKRGKLQHKVNLEFKRFGRNTVKYAKSYHRFTTRTSNLEKSTKWKLIENSHLRIFIDDEKAPYGKRIHNGFGGWSPDKYLARAIRPNKRLFLAKLKGVLK